MSILYHYTSADALLGMLSLCSKSNPYMTFWASYETCMNDTQENIEGYNFCLTLLPKIEEALMLNEQEKFSKLLSSSLFDEIVKKIVTYSNLSKISSTPHYIISLSKISDLLPMWRMYAGCNGLCIGLDREIIEKNGTNLLDCVYNQENILAEVVDDIVIALTEIYEKVLKLEFDNNSDKNEELIGIKKAYLLHLRIKNYLAYIIKNRSYIYEQEARIVLPENDNILYRGSKGAIIPYIEYKLPIEALKEIIVGPTQNFNYIEEPILKLLKSKDVDIERIIIKHSQVPYRE